MQNSHSALGYAMLPQLKPIPEATELVQYPLTSEMREHFRQVLIAIATNCQTLHNARTAAIRNNENTAVVDKALQHYGNIQDAAKAIINRDSSSTLAHAAHARASTLGTSTPGKAVTPRPLGPPPTSTPAELRERRRREREAAERRDTEEELKERLAAPKSVKEQNIEAARQRQAILDREGIQLSDYEYRTMLQLNMHGLELNEAITPDVTPHPGPPASPSKTLRSGRQVINNTLGGSQPSKKRGSSTAPRETTEGPKTPKRRKSPSSLYDDVENILNYQDPLPEYSIPPTPRTSRTPHPPLPVAQDDNNATIAASLNALTNLLTAQSKMFARQFNQRTPEPEIPQFYDINPGHHVPANVNGTIPFPSPERTEPRQSLWPHVENSTIHAIIQGTLPLDKLVLLIPVEHRSTTTERGDLTITNGVLQQARPTPDVGKLAKQFPTLASYLRAFTTWSAIKQTYETPDPHLAAARLMHIDGMMHLSTTASWNRVLRYELAFFRTHQNSRDPRVWSTLDTTVFLTSGLTSVTESVHCEQRLSSRIMTCFRYNRRPARGEKACNTWNCKYQHACNYDTERCNSRHPAYECPLNPSNVRRNEYRDDRRPYNGRGGNNDRNPNRIPVLEDRIRQ